MEVDEIGKGTNASKHQEKDEDDETMLIVVDSSGSETSLNTVPPKTLKNSVDKEERNIPGKQGNNGTKELYSDYNALFKSVILEHCYARPYNWGPEVHFFRPTRKLFFPPIVPPEHNYLFLPQPYRDGPVDLDVLLSDPPVNYDPQRAQISMEECEKQAKGLKPKGGDNWEENMQRTNWSTSQSHLFNSIVNILHLDKLGRLTSVGRPNEAALRRLIIEKSVFRFRKAFAKYQWDMKLVQWLHKVLLTSLPQDFLAIYLDVLQTLKHKLPMFIDKLLLSFQTREVRVQNEKMQAFLKSPWDPYCMKSLECRPLKKLPGSPVIIVVPGTPLTSSNAESKNLQRWISGLNQIGTVYTIFSGIGLIGQNYTMANAADQMYSSTKAKVQQLKAENSLRPLIIIGITTGCGIALQVAQTESFIGVVCLGFSVCTFEGSRGEPDDNLLELQCPVLFVLGEHADIADYEDMEYLRERMRVESGLLVIGSGDDTLRISKKSMGEFGIDQKFADYLIIEEVAEFLNSILICPFPPLIRMDEAPTETIKKVKPERKRNISNESSSLDSGPPSPKQRISRPGQQSLSPIIGRPPGSKKKWTSMQQGIPPPNPLNTSAINNSAATPPNTQILSPLKDSNTQNEDFQPLPTPKRIPKDNPPKATYTRATLVTKSTADVFRAKFKSMAIPPGRNIYHGSALSNLLQSNGARTLPPNPSPQTLKELEQCITSKKQILANHSKVLRTMPSGTSSSSSSPGPSNIIPPKKLTSHDIMDLPIIFADDNKMLANNVIQPSDTPSREITPLKNNSNSNNKFVFLSTPNPEKGKIMKRPTFSTKNGNALTYAQIILSNNVLEQDLQGSKTNLNTTPTTARKDPSEIQGVLGYNLENDIPINKINKSIRHLPKSKPTILNETCKPVKFFELDDDSDDPEYIPNKTKI